MYTSQDLYNWKNEGLVIEKGSIAVFERPKVLYSEIAEQYVMWFHYDNSSYTTAELGVAASGGPYGPFEVIDHFRPNGHQSRDIGMYLDPDTKKAYIGYAAHRNGSINATVRIVGVPGMDPQSGNLSLGQIYRGSGQAQTGRASGVYFFRPEEFPPGKKVELR